MPPNTAPPKIEDEPRLMIALGWAAILGCAIFVSSIFIADFAVPDHDAWADTISDLAAGKNEYIVDIGLYAFSASLICIALLCAHVHLGGGKWSFGIVALALFGLLVFLIGARNEYGDNDSEGVVIHIYVVYVIGALMAVIPFLLAEGAARADERYRRLLWVLGALWIISAPFFFILPTDVDGMYERYLGVISIVMVITIGHLYITRGYAMR